MGKIIHMWTHSPTLYIIIKMSYNTSARDFVTRTSKNTFHIITHRKTSLTSLLKNHSILLPIITLEWKGERKEKQRREKKDMKFILLPGKIILLWAWMYNDSTFVIIKKTTTADARGAHFFLPTSSSSRKTYEKVTKYYHNLGKIIQLQEFHDRWNSASFYTHSILPIWIHWRKKRKIIWRHK